MKIQKRAVAMILTLVCVLSMFSLLASAVDQITESETVISVRNEPYEYPIYRGSKEWFALSPEERISAFRVPDDIINAMSTPALLETVISNPFFAHIYAYDTIIDGYDIVKGYVDGLQELVNRPDFETTLNSYASNPATVCNNLNSADTVLPYIGTRLSALQCFTSSVQTLMSNPYVATGIGTLYYFSTPNGTGVPVYYNRTYSYYQIDTFQAQAVFEDMVADHPSATIIRNIASNSSVCTASYNCHSYAWYSTSATNKYWMDDPSAYINDGSFEESYAAAGRIVTWRRNGSYNHHSGIIEQAASGSQMSIVISKWAQYGLVMHDLTDCPYSADYTGISINAWTEA